MSESTYTLETKATEKQRSGHEELAKLFTETPMPLEHLAVNLGLYSRSSVLAKLLFLDELYRRIIGVPGIVVEFGIWRGQNLAVFENLRAIHEPFNQTRRVVGFDTFSGYPKASKQDSINSALGFNFGDAVQEGGYSTGTEYMQHLDAVLTAQQKCNILGQIKKHDLVAGDVIQTAPAYFAPEKGIVVALAYFDMALYEPTKVALECVLKCMIPGSVILLDEFNFPEAPGETIAFFEAIGKRKYKIENSSILPDRTIVTILE